MKTIDINEIDKKNFKCYKFASKEKEGSHEEASGATITESEIKHENSYYYGEVIHLDEMNNIIEDAQITEEIKPTLRLVRHGVGVMMYNVLDQNCESRYEGNWVKDKKTGLGKCYYADNSIFEGNYLNNIYEGNGCFIWPNQDKYSGEWKLGKFDGEGEFTHNDGHVLKGKFTNNYFLDVSGSIEYVNNFLFY